MAADIKEREKIKMRENEDVGVLVMKERREYDLQHRPNFVVQREGECIKYR